MKNASLLRGACNIWRTQENRPGVVRIRATSGYPVSYRWSGAMPDEPVPPLFERLPPGLFAPLSGVLAPLYWATLARYYQFEFEREPFHFVKPVASLEIAEEILRASLFWLQRGELLLA
jgi:hypothetical protein